MERKAAATSARVVERKPVRGLGHTRRSSGTTRLQQADHASSGDSYQSLDKDQSAGPIGPISTNITGPEVTDDLPELAAVLDRELDAIEAYLGASLEEMLGQLV